jgi:hypothetical protein
MKRSNVILVLIVALGMNACSSKPKYSQNYLGCINAYTYWQMKSKGKHTFGQADKWCKSQNNISQGRGNSSNSKRK